MYNDHDPVDSALQSMRSRQWAGQTFNPQLEEKLMQEFTKNPASRRFAKMPVWVVALGGVLLAGGVATGTVALVRNWLVTVQIGDKQYQFQTDGNGEGNIQVQTDDGRTANVHVQRVEGDNGHEETNVNVDVNGDGRSEQKIMKIVRGGSAAPTESNATRKDIEGTDASATWTDANGNTKSLYLVQGEGQPTRMFLVTSAADGSETIRKMTELPASIPLFSTKPEVTTTPDGDVTLSFDDGRGNKNVMKFKTSSVASHDGTLPVNGHIQIDPSAGEIKINGNPNAEKE